jgi:cellulose synthase/poly-beta-1,6-N-acetylglucosamine synthase-like glycosyltransferase
MLIGLQIILFVMQGILLALLSYLLLLTAAAAWGAKTKRTSDLHRQPNHRFLILIPAHNEEQLLPRLLSNLAGLNYPTSLYQVHVVADNCTDRTAALAREMGVTVHERTDATNRGKGAALQWLLGRIWEAQLPRQQRHDAVVILDADSYVSSNFLQVIDAQMARGQRVIQAYYAVDAPEKTWSVGLRYAAFAVLHYLRPLGRMVLGGSAGLKGNGMVFAADVMRDHQWSAALTEDIEFHMALLFDGERVDFAPDATVWAEMPASLTQSDSQHTRWESGRVDMARRYVPRLLRAAWQALRRGQIRQAYVFVDAALEHIIPPLAIFTALIVLCVLANVVLYLLERFTPISSLTYLSDLNMISVVVLVLGLAIYLLGGLRLAHAPWSAYRSLLAAPLYIGWKSRQYLSIAFSKSRPTWIRTTRNRTSS